MHAKYFTSQFYSLSPNLCQKLQHCTENDASFLLTEPHKKDLETSPKRKATKDAFHPANQKMTEESTKTQVEELRRELEEKYQEGGEGVPTANGAARSRSEVAEVLVPTLMITRPSNDVTANGN